MLNDLDGLNEIKEDFKSRSGRWKREGFDVKRALLLLLAVKMKEGSMSQGNHVASRIRKRQENTFSRKSCRLDISPVTHVGFLAYRSLRYFVLF